jgi:tetratricopeptide (TPR) repeat protein
MSMKERTSFYLACIGSAIATLVLIPGTSGPFFSDDTQYIVDNTDLAQLSIASPWGLFSGETSKIDYLPIRDASYRFDMALFGSDPFGFHIHNLLLYFLCCMLVWTASIALLKTIEAINHDVERVHTEGIASTWALLATLLFAAHPSHVEAAVWISGRKDLLATLFSLVCLFSFLNWLRRKGHAPLLLASTLMLFCLAALSKSAAVALVCPLVALSLSYLYWTRGAGDIQWRQISIICSFAALALAFTLLHIHFATELKIAAAEDELIRIPWHQTALRSLRILGVGSVISIAPISPRITYDLYSSNYDPAVLVGAVMIIALMYCAYALVRRRDPRAFGVIFLVTTLAPVLQIRPFITNSMMSDRFLLLPSFGLVFCLGGMFARRGRTLWVAVVSLAVMAGLFLSFQRSMQWKTAEGLWEHNENASPGHHVAQYMFIRSGPLALGQYEDARRRVENVREDEARDLLSAFIDAQQAVDTARTRDQVVGAASALDRLSVLLSNEVVDSRLRADLTYLLLRRQLNELAGFGYFRLLGSVNNPVLKYNAALRFSKAHLNRLAAKYFEAAAKHPSFPPASKARAWYKLGRELQKLSEHEAAVKAHKAAMESNPSAWEPALAVAKIYTMTGEHQNLVDSARAEFRRRAILSGMTDEEVIEHLSEL